jgi:hypothetical protein
VGLELPPFSYAEHGEVIIRRFLEYALHWAGGFHHQQSRAPAPRFRKLLDENALRLLF